MKEILYEENIYSIVQYSKTKKIFIKKMSNWSPVEDGEDVTTFH